MAVKFGMRNYSRTGNVVTFTVVALNADGSIDTGYTGSFTFGAGNMTNPGAYTFTAADQGQRVFSSTIIDPNNNASVAARFVEGGFNGANLSIAAPGGDDFTLLNRGEHILVGNTGDDRLTGNVDNDLFLLQSGGNDIVTGRNGNDAFYFGGAFTSDDSVNGDAGNRDQIGLQGDYAAGVTVGIVTGVEMIVLLPGNDNRFGGGTGALFSYDLSISNTVTATNNLLTVQANTLRAGENLTFNGSGSSTLNYVIYGGLGIDNLTGGSGNDGFFFGQGRFSAGDVVDGGAGTLDQLGLQGNFSIDFTQAGFAGALSNLEFIVLLSGADTRFGGSGVEYDYSITMDDGNVAAGQTMIVSANTLGSEESLAINGSDETDGRFTIYGGNGNDVLTGGANNDLIFGGGRGDTLTGGAGNDIFGYSSYADSNSTERDGIQDFNLGDRIDLSRLDANLNLAGNQDFTFIGGAAFSNTAGELRFENISLGGPIWIVQADADGNGVSDFEVVLVISPADPITAGDFIGVNPQAEELFPIIKNMTDLGEGPRQELRFDHLDLALPPTYDLIL